MAPAEALIAPPRLSALPPGDQALRHPVIASRAGCHAARARSGRWALGSGEPSVRPTASPRAAHHAPATFRRGRSDRARYRLMRPESTSSRDEHELGHSRLWSTVGRLESRSGAGSLSARAATSRGTRASTKAGPTACGRGDRGALSEGSRRPRVRARAVAAANRAVLCSRSSAVILRTTRRPSAIARSISSLSLELSRGGEVALRRS